MNDAPVDQNELRLTATTPYEVPAFAQAEGLPDPDNPRWGPLTGIVVWIASIAAVFVVPVIVVLFWYVLQLLRGAAPDPTIRGEMEQWVMSPTVVLVQVVSIIAAHGITLVFCWAVVTKVGSRPFRASLGWNWAGKPVWYWIVFSVCVFLAVQIVSKGLSRVLPEAQDTPMAQLLRTSQQVRIAVAVLATFTAPVVEEIVYRGVLFSSLLRHIGLRATVLVVTITFAGVHVLQNRGAWVSIAGLTVLSLILTIVRAKTKSILPCIVIHTLNNAVISILIVFNKAT